jgi:hypothetical protein
MLLHCATVVLVFASACLADSELFAQSLPTASSAEADKDQITAALQLTQQAASKYEFIFAGTNSDRPKLLAEPVLRWSNPAAGHVHGNVYLWTLEGRPAIVGSLFKWFSPHTHMSHEFQSLAEQPLIGKFDGREVWNCGEPGLRFAALSNAPRPAGGKTQRLLQMRELARNFTVMKRERDGSTGELRLLPQPIYRYDAPQAGVIDGGLFAFVQGTDPDLFLLLEVRESGGNLTWQFAASRMNSVALSLQFNAQVIWQVDVLPWSDVNNHRLPYTSFRHDMP